MNFNATRVGPGRKVKRVSDTSAMGTPLPSTPPPVYSPYENAYAMADGQQFGQQQSGQFGQQQPGQFGQQQQPGQFGQQQQQSGQFGQQQQPGQFGQPAQFGQPQPGQFGQQQQPYSPGVNPYAVFNTPIVQDVARQYGEQLANQGKQMVDQHLNRYVPVSQLKVYFAVSNSYVIKKLQLLFMPFLHKDWSIPYSESYPSQPRNATNMPDLYIPTMAYITFVLFAGFNLGMQKRFTPELIGIVASSTLAYSLLETFVYKIIMYIYNVNTNLKILDLFSSCGYKYPVLLLCVAVNALLNRTWYYVCLVYCGLALSFFLVRSLKYQMFASSNAYGEQDGTGHTMRRGFYFLLFVAGLQPLLLWLFSYELVYGVNADPAVIKS